MIYKIDLKFQQTFLPNMICLKCTLWFDIYNFLFMIPMFNTWYFKKIKRENMTMCWVNNLLNVKKIVKHRDI